MHRASRAAFVVGLFVAEVAALLTLQRLGRVAGFAFPDHAVGHWLLHTPTEDLFAVAARGLGLLLVWWLLAGTALSTARRVVPGWHRVRALDVATPAAVRHALDRALTIGLGASLGLASIHAGAAGAATSGPRRRDVPVVRLPTAPPTRPATPTVPAPTARTAAPSVPAERVVVVRAGDNLWVIAQRALQSDGHVGGGEIRAAEIAPYWRRVIAANRANLRSHDPNLIFPGERVVLPPTSG